MVCVCMDGFENGNAATVDLFNQGDGYNVHQGADLIGLSLCSSSTNIGTTGRVIGKYFNGAASDIIYGHMSVWPYSFNGNANESSVVLMIWGDNHATLHLSVMIDSSGRFLVARGDWNGTVLQTSTLNIPVVSAWRSLQFKVRVHDTLGEFILKVDGVEFLNYTGDTKNGGTATKIDGVGLRSKSGQTRMDDIFINDTTGSVNNTWTGQVTIAGLRPIGNGAHSGLVGTDGNSVDNYQLVDEYPLNTTDYVANGVIGSKDTYDFSALTKVGTIVGVQSTVYAAKGDAGTRLFKHIRRTSGGSISASSDVPLSTTWLLYYGPVWETQADASPWTLAAVNSHEYGIEVS